MLPPQRDALVARYAAGFDRVREALDGMGPADLTARPIPGKWTAAEIIHHLADSETISAIRLRRLLAEHRPVIAGYDQDLYAVRLRYNERPVEPALEAFRLARVTTLQVIATMLPEDWTREGWHTESGLYTPERWLEIYAAHAHGHAEQIVRLRAALRGGGA